MPTEVKVPFAELDIPLRPSTDHDWILETSLVALGYGVTSFAIRKHKHAYDCELKEGVHYLCVTNSNAQNYGIQLPPMVREQTYWTKAGVIRLGFFIRSPRAVEFRN